MSKESALSLPLVKIPAEESDGENGESTDFHRLRKSSGLARSLIALAQAEPALSSAGPACKYSASTPSYRLALFEHSTGFFACTASCRAVFVAGGHDEEKNALRSALAYDVARDEWASLPDMERERDECKGVFLRGRFHVVGGYCTEAQGRFGRSAEAFDTDTWRWKPVEDDYLEVGTCPRTAAAGGDGRMYMCREGHVAVREDAGWRAAAAELPEDARVAPQVLAWEGNLLVMGSGCHGGAQAGYVTELGRGRELAWQKVEVPEEYSGHVQAGCCIEV